MDRKQICRLYENKCLFMILVQIGWLLILNGVYIVTSHFKSTNHFEKPTCRKLYNCYVLCEVEVDKNSGVAFCFY